jgi:hypothetical protein
MKTRLMVCWAIAVACGAATAVMEHYGASAQLLWTFAFCGGMASGFSYCLAIKGTTDA